MMRYPRNWSAFHFFTIFVFPLLFSFLRPKCSPLFPPRFQGFMSGFFSALRSVPPILPAYFPGSPFFFWQFVTPSAFCHFLVFLKPICLALYWQPLWKQASIPGPYLFFQLCIYFFRGICAASFFLFFSPAGLCEVCQDFLPPPPDFIFAHPIGFSSLLLLERSFLDDKHRLNVVVIREWFSSPCVPPPPTGDCFAVSTGFTSRYF